MILVIEMNINLEYYKIFYYIAKNKNITKAATELNISQPAISRMLKTLENQLNCVLFIRQKRGVILTKEGKELYNQISNNIFEIINAENNFKKITKNHSIKICTDSNILNYLIYNNKININELNSNIIFYDINGLSNGFNSLNNSLINNLIDCAIITENNNFKFDESLEFKKIADLHICLASFNDFEEISNINNCTFILQDKNSRFGNITNNYIEKSHLNFNKSIVVDNYENILPLLQLENTVGFIIKELIPNNIKFNIISKEDDFPTIPIGILYNKNNKNLIDRLI